MWGLKRDFPELDFSLNGGLESCHQAAAALQHSPSSSAEEGAGDSSCSIHGVMIGRAAFHAPWTCLSDADVAVFGAAANAAASRREVWASSSISPYTIQGAPCSVQWHTIWCLKSLPAMHSCRS